MITTLTKKYITGIFVFVAFVLFSAVAFAQVIPYKVLIYTHTRDGKVGGAYVNSYSAFNNVPGATVVTRDITGLSFGQYQSLLRQDMISGQNLLIYGGHGSLSDLSTDGVSFTRDYAMRAASNIASEKGGQVTGIVESCGSGNVCGVSNLAGEGALDGVYTAAAPGDYGWVFSEGGPWYAKFGEQFKGTLSHFGDGTKLDPDTNKDGVLTHGELAKALYGDKANSRSQVPDPDKPFAFKNSEIAAKYQKFTECIILRPGQVDESYSGSASTSGEVSGEFKPSQISGYEHRTGFPDEFPVLGQVQDRVRSDESKINFDLRRLGSDFIEKHVQRALDTKVMNAGIKKRIILLPTKAQAEEFVNSLGGSAGAQGKYTLGGVEVEAGKHYLANHPSPQDKIEFDSECNLKPWSQPSPEPSANPDAAKNNNGNGNGGGGNASAPAGNNSLLDALMKALLGKAGQPGQGQGNQNPYGAGLGNASQCASQGISPVCGADGKTYNNPCYLVESQTVQVSEGVCPGGSIVTPQSANVLNQLSQSGIPLTLLDALKNVIAGMLSNIFFGANVRETVVQ